MSTWGWWLLAVVYAAGAFGWRIVADEKFAGERGAVRWLGMAVMALLYPIHFVLVTAWYFAVTVPTQFGRQQFEGRR